MNKNSKGKANQAESDLMNRLTNLLLEVHKLKPETDIHYEANMMANLFAVSVRCLLPKIAVAIGDETNTGKTLKQTSFIQGMEIITEVLDDFEKSNSKIIEVYELGYKMATARNNGEKLE